VNAQRVADNTCFTNSKMLAINTLVPDTLASTDYYCTVYGMYLAADKNTLEDEQRTDDANTGKRGCERARTNPPNGEE
jgi:hypothetical protein